MRHLLIIVIYCSLVSITAGTAKAVSLQSGLEAHFRHLTLEKPDSQTDVKKIAVEKVRALITEVVNASYPELKNQVIRVKPFQSDADYFRAGFSLTRFFLGQKMRYTIFVNPEIIKRAAPENGLRAILAHELAHIVYFRKRNRLALLGLVRLTTKSFTVHFERGADLEAINRGYGLGLGEYREWLYQNIPSRNIKEKKRNYFSPEEIKLLIAALKQKPELFQYWRKHLPRSQDEILNATKGMLKS